MLALVTGASRGIGAAAARRLAADGWRVIIHYKSSGAKALALADELGGTAIAADLADPAQIDAMLENIRTQLGKPELLVNNAGVSVTDLYQSVSDAAAEWLFAVNTAAPMRLAKRLLPDMIAAHRGCIINIASVWGECGAACEVHYSASKAALIGFTKALAKEVGPAGIRVNCVSPGVIATDMNRIHDAETMAALRAETPLDRIGTPEEVAEVIAFLASERARFVTGQIIGTNGGFGI